MSDLPKPLPVQPSAPDGVLLAISNAPDEQTAQTIARSLVEEGLAACVNILPAGQSIYRWQGAIEQAQELALIIKTSRRRFPALTRRLSELHPHDVPELLAIAPDAVLPAYADWVLRETRSTRR